MASLTEAQQLAFSYWMKDLLTENKTDIEEAATKKGITFDTDGYLKQFSEKETSYKGEEGKETKLTQQLRTQTKSTNATLGDWYKSASAAVEAVIGAIGKEHKLSVIMRNKRDSMANEAARGPEEPQNP